MRHPFEVALASANQFRQSLTDRAPRPSITAAALEARWGGPVPEQGARADTVIEALVHAAEPGLVASPGRRFFGWIIGAAHEAAVAADWLTSAWGQNAGLYATSPSAAMSEKVSSRWLLDMLRLPEECSVGFVTGATMATFTCLAAARNAVLTRVGWNVEALGLNGAPRVRVLVSADAHASVFAALRFLGLGAETVERIETDAEGRMLADALGRALDADAGPAIVIAQAGQINTGAFDPFRAIDAHCERQSAWLHVDGAFGLWGRLCPELEHLTNGLERADSWATDGHKWLQLPYDSGFAIVRDAAAHRRAMAISASYLPPGEYEPGHFTPELSRRARGFALWALLRTLGRDGVREMVRRHCRCARQLAAILAATPGVHVVNQVVLNQLIVRFGEDDAATHAVIARLQAENLFFAEGAHWRGRWVMRLSIIAADLDDDDIERLAGAIVRAWRSTEARAVASVAV
jgi:glutamate/tyrosine decarboxylase-like PLP-dependent enzyme